MTSLIISEINKLKNFQQSLEKNQSLFHFLSKYGTEENLCGFLTNLEKVRNVECNKISHELWEILESVDQKQHFFKNGDADIQDPKSFKKDMILLQDTIQNLKLKLKNEYELLKDQEKELTEELQLFEPKVEEWKKPLKHIHNVTFKINRENHQSDDNSTRERSRKEVKKFMEFLNKNNGHENGWASEDHQLFLKIRKKFKDSNTVAHHLHKLLPDISVEDIKNHEIWYCQYTELRNKIKEAISNWKSTKLEKNSHPDQTIIKDNQVKKKHILKAENSREKIAQWKAEKEAKRSQEIEMEHLKRQHQRQLHLERETMRQEIKKSVEKWKEVKSRKEEIETLEKELKELKIKKIKSAEANKMIKLFQSQDDIFVGKLKQRHNKNRGTNQEIKRSKSSHTASRDPERLLKPTKQWTHRTAKKDNYFKEPAETSKLQLPNIKEIPKLKVPDWRRNS